MATINLFEKFDADGSGALDSEELTALYNDMGVAVTEDEIKRLYGDENVKFTLEMFESLPKDLKKLQQFRRALKTMRYRLDSEVIKNDFRKFIPSTFEAMMHDFGTRVVRKDLLERQKQSSKSIMATGGAIDHQKLEMNISEHADVMKKLFETTKLSLSLMYSADNQLFRKTKEKALRDRDNVPKERLSEVLRSVDNRRRGQARESPVPLDPSEEAIK